MTSPSGPRPVGNVLWLALGAFVLAAVLIATGAPVLPFLLFVLAVTWGWSGSRATCVPGTTARPATRRPAGRSPADLRRRPRPPPAGSRRPPPTPADSR